MVRVSAHFGQGSGRIDIPEDTNGAGPRGGDDAGEKLVVENPDATRLDYDICGRGLGDHATQGFLVRGIDAYGRPIGGIDVAMLLPPERIGFVERDSMATPGEILEQAAIVSGRPVPIGRQKAGS